MHQRTVIRHAVRDLLVAAGVADGRVFASRVLPFRGQELPLVTVYTLDETTASEGSTAPRELTRTLPLVIEGWAAPGQNADDNMDALALEIETAMHADPFLGGEAADSILDATVMEVTEAGERQIGLVILTYTFTYRTLAPEPPADGEMDDFVTVGADHDAAGAVASDLFDVQVPDES